MVGVGPCVRAVCKAFVGEVVEDALVRVLLRSEEDEVLECVRSTCSRSKRVSPCCRFGRDEERDALTCVVKDFCPEHEAAVHDGTLDSGPDDRQARLCRAPLLDRCARLRRRERGHWRSSRRSGLARTKSIKAGHAAVPTSHKVTVFCLVVFERRGGCCGGHGACRSCQRARRVGGQARREDWPDGSERKKLEDGAGGPWEHARGLRKAREERWVGVGKGKGGRCWSRSWAESEFVEVSVLAEPPTASPSQ